VAIKIGVLSDPSFGDAKDSRLSGVIWTAVAKSGWDNYFEIMINSIHFEGGPLEL
jgi:hypothetical protein